MVLQLENHLRDPEGTGPWGEGESMEIRGRLDKAILEKHLVIVQDSCRL